MRRQAWKAHLVVGVILGAVYLALPERPAKLVLWPMIGWSAVACTIVGTHRNRPKGRWAWYFVAAGLALFIAGDNLYSYRSLVEHATALFPSVVDVLYLVMYPVLVTGLLLLVRHRTPGRDWASAIDAAIVTVGLGLVSWVLLIVPYVRANDMTFFERFVSMAYPVGDVAVLAVTVRLAVGGGRRPTAFWLMCSGIVPLIVTDSVYGWMNLAGTWREHTPIDAGWIAFYVCWGAAALHPSMASLSERTTVRSNASRARLVVIGAASLVPPALLLIESLNGSVRGDGAAIAIAAIVVFSLVLIRIAGLAREVGSRQSEVRFRSLVQNSSDAIVVIDSACRVHYWTASTERMFDRSPDELDGAPLRLLLHANDATAAERLYSGDAVAHTVEWRARRRSDETFYVEASSSDLRRDPDVGGVVLTLRDVSERKALEHELRVRAFHDPLTGLANRAQLRDRLEHAVLRANDTGAMPALLFVDLDDFKLVNDALGHVTGDALLVAVGRRFDRCVRAVDTVARLGGDEFAVLVEDNERAHATAQALLDALRQPFNVDGRSHTVHASVGIAIASEHGGNVSDLLRDADLAMYAAKEAGKSRIEVFDPSQRRAVEQRVDREGELRRAIERNEFVLFYQPVFEFATGEIIGAEALIRWQHPVEGLLGPGAFIDLAETSGLIADIGRWVLRQGCIDAAAWRRRTGVPLRVAVNVSSRQFDAPGFVDDVALACRQASLPGDGLIVEITESLLIRNSDANTSLESLHAAGVHVAIDDFGTGYSSFAYLRRFAIDVLKIDRSFVTNADNDPVQRGLVVAMTTLAKTLGLRTVAEGIETDGEAATLRELGCDFAQGFLLARPMPVDAFHALLDERYGALSALPSGPAPA